MYSKDQLKQQLVKMGLQPSDTVLVHSSMKAIGEVEDRAEGVLDVLIDYFKDGLLIFPTHTWEQMGEKKLLFDPKTEPSCVGLLSNLFLKRAGVSRSLHPTHSVAAIGEKSEKYLSDDDTHGTPCHRYGCFGKLYDYKAKLLFIGVGMDKNTFIHSVEEWMDVPNRLTDRPVRFKVKLPNGAQQHAATYRHVKGGISEKYVKMTEPFLAEGCMTSARFGEADCYVGDAVKMADLLISYLERDLHLFDDFSPVPVSWYKDDENEGKM